MIIPRSRRSFISRSCAAVLGLGAAPLAGGKTGRLDPADQIADARPFLDSIIYTEKEVKDWLAGRAFPFAKYHSEFGWLLNNARFRDGQDDSESVYTFVGQDGERIMSNYAEVPCRINTYGNSFTQCHQVSDHETWQEVMAAHLQEPVRNFGIGGWSVYQAYLRMLKEEKRTPAEYIVFNIFDDDHRRNLDSWRNIRVRKHPNFIEPTLPHVKVNVAKKTFREYENPCPTPQSVYQLADASRVYEMFKDDFVLQIMLAHKNSQAYNPNQSYTEIMELAQTHGIETEIENSATLEAAANQLHERSALYASQVLVDKIIRFARENRKKLLFVLSYPARTIARYLDEGVRWDQSFVDFMVKKELHFVDLLEAHAQEFSKFRLSSGNYLKKYFIGHYNPLGNLFCAFVLKNKLVEMLDPKPLPYGS